MKKTGKILTLVLCACLLVAISIGATVAYLTSTDEVTNTFTVGNVAITLDEANVAYDTSDNVYVAQDGRTKTNSYKLLSGTELAKDPTVTVLADSEACYVRALVTVTYKTEADVMLAENLWKDWIEGYDDSKWSFVEPVATSESGDTTTRTYELRYANMVPAATADTVLPAIFTGIKIPGTLTNEQLALLDKLEINVKANAIQAGGFADADAAWTAFDE